MFHKQSAKPHTVHHSDLKSVISFILTQTTALKVASSLDLQIFVYIDLRQQLL